MNRPPTTNHPFPKIMGIINASPNSFYAPVHSLGAALKQAAKMIQEGVDILDVGGEATNPQVNIANDGPSAQAEIDRVAPLIEAIKQRFDVMVSVDTSKPAVMQAAVEAGVDMLNDQRSLSVPGALAIAIKADVPVVLMHNFEPIRTPGATHVEQLLSDIVAGFQQLLLDFQQHGLKPEHIVLDPGFGQGNYGKNTAENFYILDHLDQLTALGYPVLAGWSRKSMIGDVLGGVPADARLYGSIGVALRCAMQGVAILRVHDVGPTVQALSLFLKQN